MDRLRARFASSAAAFRQAFANRSLRRLQLAAAGSMIGSWAYGVALVVYAYDVGGATAVGLTALIRFVPAAIASPFAALAADRFPRARVMLVADLVRAGAMFAAAGAIAADASPVVVFTAATVSTVTSTAFRPAQAALLPTLVRTPEELTASNVVASTIDSIGVFIGPAIGGLVLAVSGPDAVFALNGVTFLWSATFVLGLIGAERPMDRKGVKKRNALLEAFRGFGEVWREPQLRLVVGLTAAQTLVFGALTVLVAVLALELLDTGAEGVGFLNSALGVGGLVGSLAAFAIAGRPRLGSTFGLAIAFWGLPLALVGVWPNPVVALILFGVIGGANTLVDVSGLTVLQRTASESVLGRVFGVLEGLIIITVAIGAMIAPLLVETIGARAALVATGAVLPVLAAISWRHLGHLDAVAVDAHARERELLEAIPMFGVLPPAPLERLAAALHPVQVSAGETVFRQGDSGDRFYVVSDGSVEVRVDGAEAGTLWPGEFFGEIAILRDVPRTATVVAREDTTLYALEREDFLAAVTGTSQALDAAEAVAGDRLAAARPTPASSGATAN
jgi:MFS family permease